MCETSQTCKHDSKYWVQQSKGVYNVLSCGNHLSSAVRKLSTDSDAGPVTVKTKRLVVGRPEGKDYTYWG